MNTYYAYREGVRAIIDKTKHLLPERDISNAVDMLEHDEWGAALHIICSQLFEYDVVIERKLFDEMKSLAEEMGMPKATWSDLLSLVNDDS